MSLSLKITPKEVYRLPRPDTGKAAEIAERTRRINTLTFDVKAHWEEMPPALRDALIDLAYSDPSEAPPKNLAAQLRSLRSRWLLAGVFRRDPEIIREFLNSVSNLIEAVLDAIERENPKYQEALTEAIEEALSDTNGRAMNAEEARERNQELFDQALE